MKSIIRKSWDKSPNRLAFDKKWIKKFLQGKT